MAAPPDHSFIVHVRSKDCGPPDSKYLTDGFNTDIEVELDAPIKRMPGHQFHISLASAEIPYTWYNVSDELSTRQLRVNNASSLTLAEGTYDIYELVDTINTANTNNLFPFSIVYLSKTNKVQLTNTTAASSTLNFSQKECKGLAKMLGFDTENDSASITQNQTLISTGIVNLRPVHSMLLHSDLAASNVYTTNNGSTENIIDKIPIGRYEPLDSISYDYGETAPFSTVININAIQNFKLSLRDQNSNLIQLNNVNYELSLLIEQKLHFQHELDHPGHPLYVQDESTPPTPPLNEEEDKTESEKVSSDLDPRSPRTKLAELEENERLANLSGVDGLMQTGDDDIQTRPSISVKRPRVMMSNEQIKRKELELDQAIMMAHDSIL